MTPYERANPDVISQSRRNRLAKGSGKSLDDINALMKQFEQMKQMMKMMNKMPMGGTRAARNAPLVKIFLILYAAF
jgi:signal recognition particle subunit SRP54